MTSNESNDLSSRKAKALALAGLAIASHTTSSQAAIVHVDIPVAGVPSFVDPDTLEPSNSGNPPYRFVVQSGSFLALNDGADDFAWASLSEVLSIGDLVSLANTYTMGTEAMPDTFFGDQGTSDFRRFVGFRWENQGAGNNETWYGWAELQGDMVGGGTLTVTQYAYDNSGNSIAAGTVPEPSAVLLMVAGVFLPTLRRRRHS